MSNTTFVKNVMVGTGENSDSLANLAAAGIQGLAKGDLVLLDQGMNVITTAAAAAALADDAVVYIANQKTNRLDLSAPLTRKNVRNIGAKAFAATAQKVVYLGFNGTSGSIPVADGKEYRLTILYKDDQRMLAHRQTTDLYYYKAPETGATEAAAVFEIVRQAAAYKGTRNPNTTRTSNEYVKIEAVSNGTTTALGASATLSVTKGSKLVTASAAGHALVAGDEVRIGGSGATLPVYKVESVDGASIVLESAYQGDTASGVAGFEMSAQTDYGFKITALAQTIRNVDRYKVVDFTASYAEQLAELTGASVDPSEAATVTVAQKYSPGFGNPLQVKDAEFNVAGNHGQTNHIHFPYDNIDYLYNTSLGAGFHVLTIEAFTDFIGDFQAPKSNPVAVTIYIGEGQEGGTNPQVMTAGEGFVRCLESWYAGSAIAATGGITGDSGVNFD